jgi:hypothetical protein
MHHDSVLGKRASSHMADCLVRAAGVGCVSLDNSQDTLAWQVSSTCPYVDVRCSSLSACGDMPAVYLPPRREPVARLDATRRRGHGG